MIMVVEILVIQRKANNALSQQIDLAMRDEIGRSPILQNSIQRPAKYQLPIHRSQQHHSSVAGRLSTLKTSFDLATIKA
ncbi:hypothetical protein BH09VER1_BH09VER1_36520 [soil metagenome]